MHCQKQNTTRCGINEFGAAGKEGIQVVPIKVTEFDTKINRRLVALYKSLK